jgi:dihydroorotase
LKAKRRITDGWIESRCSWTPYDGKEIVGWPIGTLVRGRKVMWDGEILGAAAGQAIKFVEALRPGVEGHE